VDILRDGIMTDYQQGKLHQLQSELMLLRGIAQPLQAEDEDNGYVFTRVEGVTVVVTKRANPNKPFGGFILPAVMTYKETGQRPDTSLDAAVWADRRFSAQIGKPIRQKGHLGPIVGLDWRCAHSGCPCRDEGSAELARRNGVALQ
jgi:hypothetical protein